MSTKKKPSNEEKIIHDHFKEVLDKDPVRNNDLDTPPEVDLEIRPKKEEDGIVADEC